MIKMIMIKMMIMTIKMMLMLMLIVGLTQILIPDHNSVTRTRKPQQIHKRNLSSPYLCIKVQTDHYMCRDLEKILFFLGAKSGAIQGETNFSSAAVHQKYLHRKQKFMWTDNHFPNYVDR